MAHFNWVLFEDWSAQVRKLIILSLYTIFAALNFSYFYAIISQFIMHVKKEREIQTRELNGARFCINEMRRQSHLVVVKSCCLSAMHEYNMWSQCEGDYSPLNRCKKEWTKHSSLWKYYNNAILNNQQGQGFRNDLLKNTRWWNFQSFSGIQGERCWPVSESSYGQTPEGRCELSSLCPSPQVTPGGQSGQWGCCKDAWG